MSGASVDSPNIFGNGEVQDSVNQQRGRLNECGLICLKSPCQREAIHVFGSDLGKSTVTAARVVAMVSWPTVGGWMQQHLFVDSLRREKRREPKSSERAHSHQECRPQKVHNQKIPTNLSRNLTHYRRVCR